MVEKMLSDFLIGLADSPVVYASLSIGILLFILTFLYLLGARKVKRPYYQIRSWNIVKDFNGTFESVNILHEGVPVQNLTVTKIAFWNSGREAIYRDDIAPKDPLRIELEDEFKILEIPQLEGKINPANNIKLITSEDESQIQFDFDCLGKNEGLVAQIVHNGLSSRDLKFEGTIKGSEIKQARPVNNIPSIVLAGFAIIALFAAGYRVLEYIPEHDFALQLRARERQSILEHTKKLYNLSLDKLKSQPKPGGTGSTGILNDLERERQEIEKIEREVEKLSQEIKLLFESYAEEDPIWTSTTFWLFVIALMSACSSLFLFDSEYTSASLNSEVPNSFRRFVD